MGGRCSSDADSRLPYSKREMTADLCRRSWTLAAISIAMHALAAAPTGAQPVLSMQRSENLGQLGRDRLRRDSAEPIKSPGAPPAPILELPEEEAVVVGDRYRFHWRDGIGEPRATSFRVCFALEGAVCGLAGSVVYPRPGDSRIEQTWFEMPDGAAALLAGRAMTWTVGACAPNAIQLSPKGMTAESCTYAVPRSLLWPLAPPQLLGPEDGSQAGTLRPGFHWTYMKSAEGRLAIDAVDYWLLCIARAGARCSTQVRTHSDHTVIRVARAGMSPTGAVPLGLTSIGFVPSEPLALLDEGAVEWTVAACNALFGCRYQSRMRHLSLARPGAPTLSVPSAGAALPLPPMPADPRVPPKPVPVRFAWSSVPGAVEYRFCLKAVGEVCSESKTRSSRTPELIFPVDYSFWQEAEDGKRHNWVVTACNERGICGRSSERPIAFEIPSYSFFWLYTGFQDPKCTNCHGMASGNDVYIRHVREGRIIEHDPPGYRWSDPTERSYLQASRNTRVGDKQRCATCHRRDNGFVDDWRAPSHIMDFRRFSPRELCLFLRTSSKNEVASQARDELRDHLLHDQRVRWAVFRMTQFVPIDGQVLRAVTNDSLWAARVTSWINGPGSANATVYC